MRSVVVDASAVLDHLLAPTVERGLGALIQEGGVRLCVPDVFHAEALSAIRSLCLRGDLSVPRARLFLDLLERLPTAEFPTRPLLAPAFEYRDNFSAYDALYVVLAESLGGALLTADRRLAEAVERFTALSVIA